MITTKKLAHGYFVMVFFIEFIRLESCLPIVSPTVRKSLKFELENQLFSSKLNFISLTSFLSYLISY